MHFIEFDNKANEHAVTHLCKKVIPKISFLHFKNIFFALVHIRRRFKDAFDDQVKDVKRGAFDSSKLLQIYPKVWEIVKLNEVLSSTDPNTINSVFEHMVRGVGELQIPESEDVIGEFYVYLLHTFSGVDGKYGGQYFTPRCLSRLIYEIAATHHQDKKTLTVYDPTSGSGSLLLRFAKWPDVRLYGQEIDRYTHALSLLGFEAVGMDSSGMMCGDTLATDMHEGKQFDIVVANPPFSLSWELKDSESHRFQLYGTAPKNRADWAFIHHMLNKVKETGIVVSLCFGGMLHRGKQEANVRSKVLEAGKIKAVISLPPNLFYGTSINVTLMVMSHERNERVLFIDASEEYEERGKIKFLNDNNINWIVNKYSRAIKDPESFAEEAEQSKLVEVAEILESHESSLNPYEYIDKHEEAIESPEEQRSRFLKLLNQTVIEDLRHIRVRYRNLLMNRLMGDLTEEMKEFMVALENLKPLWEKYLKDDEDDWEARYEKVRLLCEEC